MEEYKFYMIRYGESDAVWKDLETDFPGLRYKECTGLNSYGEPTNMYAEDFAETSKAEVYVSSTPAHKQTTIKLTLIFLEDDTKDDKSTVTLWLSLLVIRLPTVIQRGREKCLCTFQEPQSLKATPFTGRNIRR